MPGGREPGDGDGMGLVVFAGVAAFLAWVIGWAIRKGNDGARRALWPVLPFLLLALGAPLVSILDVRDRASMTPIESLEELRGVPSHERVLLSGTVDGDDGEWVWTSRGPALGALPIRLEGGTVELHQPLVEGAERYGISEIGVKAGADAYVFGTYWAADGQVGEGVLYTATTLEAVRSELLWWEAGPAAVAGVIALLGLLVWVLAFRHPKRAPEGF